MPADARRSSIFYSVWRLSLGLLIGLLLAALIGLSLGLIGGGGSIITVPILVYVIGVDAHTAIPLSLAVVGSTSLVGALMHRREGNLEIGTAALFGASGILGAFLGSRITYLISDRALLLIFGVLMFVVATLMLARKEQRETGDERPHRAKAVAAGFGVGTLTGFLGVGGGFLIVPALMLFGGLGIRKAIGTSLLVIMINCASGIVAHLQYGGIDWQLAALVATPAMLGALVGTQMSVKASPVALRKGFAVFVILVAIYLLVRNV